MKRNTKTLIAALGATLFAIAPAVANAERVYLLVGSRHIYKIGTFEYANVEARQKIEQDYADQVAADQEQFNKAVADGANPAEEGANLNAALDELAIERDKELSEIYRNADYEMVRHPELRIEGDGPYQVMAINYHWLGSVEVFDDFRVYAPWNGYVVVDRPYGWEYGRVYRPYEFRTVYSGWHGRWVAGGRYAFVGMYGRGGYIRYNIDRRYRFEREVGRHHLRAEDRTRYFKSPERPPFGRKPWEKSEIKKPWDKPTERKPYEKVTERKPYEKATERKPYEKVTERKLYEKPAERKPFERPTERKPFEKPTERKPAPPTHQTTPPHAPVVHPPKKG